MADLLGSILGAMEKPPTLSKSDRKRAKAEEEKLMKLKKQERIEKEKFRKKIEGILSQFLKDASKTRERLKPMNKLERSIVHEMSDEAGIMTQAFGIEEHDRCVMLFKKEFPPSDEELEAYRRGEAWNEERANEIKRNKEMMEKRLQEEEEKSRVTTASIKPSSNYKDKYNHIIGTSAAKEAARKTEANKSFGMVPSVNKRDQRSIEETMNDIRAKKRQKKDKSQTF